jgi:carbonic anhydrase
MRSRTLAAAALAGMAAAALYAQAQAPAAAAPSKAGGVQTQATLAEMTPAKALFALTDGNARFVAGQREPRDYKAQVHATASGQYPFAAIVSCMDSRAPVEIVFDRGIGDVFSIRNAGNVIDQDVLGSLEYAAQVVGVKLILVMGHTHCGAVKGAIDGVQLGNLTQLLEKIRPAVGGKVPPAGSKDDAFVAKVGRDNVFLASQEIYKKSPIIKALVDSRKVAIANAMYDVDTGKVSIEKLPESNKN